jgi:hypothetical protein
MFGDFELWINNPDSPAVAGDAGEYAVQLVNS